MKIGLAGLPNSGKTTIFNALTRSEAEVGTYANNKAEPNVAVVEVGDERITRLTSLYHPKKTIYATIEIVDFAGLAKSFDIEGELAETPADFRNALKRATAATREGRPYLIDAIITQVDQRGRRTDEVWYPQLSIAERRNRKV